MPVPSGGHAAAVLGGELFVVGGTNWRGGEKFWLDEIQRYDPAQRAWSPAGRLPTSIAYAASASDGERLYLCGGSDAQRDLRACLALSRKDRGLRCQPIPPLPEARVYAGGAICDGVLYVVAGAADHADLSTTAGSLLAMDLNDERMRWRELSPLGTGRFIPAVTSAAGRLYVFGGGRLDPEGEVENLADAWAYDPQANEWMRLPDLPQAARGIDAVTVDDDLILLFGGYTATAEQARARGPAFGFSDHVIAFRPAERRLEAVGHMPYAAIGTAPALADGRVYLTGGEDRMRHRTDTLAIATTR
jgi:N-acetylneuraminic acid mutarotase